MALCMVKFDSSLHRNYFGTGGKHNVRQGCPVHGSGRLAFVFVVTVFVKLVPAIGVQA